MQSIRVVDPGPRLPGDLDPELEHVVIGGGAVERAGGLGHHEQGEQERRERGSLRRSALDWNLHIFLSLLPTGRRLKR